MEYANVVQGILRCEGIDDPILLGAGEDACAFALSDREGIRIFPKVLPDFVSALAVFYERLGEHPFSFQCPRIYDVRT